MTVAIARALMFEFRVGTGKDRAGSALRPRFHAMVSIRVGTSWQVFFKSLRKGVIRVRWEDSEKHVMVLIWARRRRKFWGFGTLFYAENTSQNAL